VAEVLAEAARLTVLATVAPLTGSVRFTVRGGATELTVTVAELEAVAPKLSLTVSVAANVPAAE
jgi:hypothetical protein